MPRHLGQCQQDHEDTDHLGTSLLTQILLDLQSSHLPIKSLDHQERLIALSEIITLFPLIMEQSLFHIWSEIDNRRDLQDQSDQSQASKNLINIFLLT